MLRCCRREAAYEARGMDSSYLFRIDEMQVIDATLKVRALQTPLSPDVMVARVPYTVRA